MFYESSKRVQTDVGPNIFYLYLIYIFNLKKQWFHYRFVICRLLFCKKFVELGIHRCVYAGACSAMQSHLYVHARVHASTGTQTRGTVSFKQERIINMEHRKRTSSPGKKQLYLGGF